METNKGLAWRAKEGQLTNKAQNSGRDHKTEGKPLETIAFCLTKRGNTKIPMVSTTDLSPDQDCGTNPVGKNHTKMYKSEDAKQSVPA